MKALILGAGGVVGQHIRLAVPEGWELVNVQRSDCGGLADVALELDDDCFRFTELIERYQPDVVANLVGENSVDAVEANPRKFWMINKEFPSNAAHRCNGKFIHFSTQAVLDPVSRYGLMRSSAEIRLLDEHSGDHVSIIRPNFVLGIRPDPSSGRENPAEQMLRDTHQKQVNDRWFSPTLAADLAFAFWRIVTGNDKCIRGHGGFKVGGVPIYQIADCLRVTRYEVARKLNPGAEIEALSQDAFAWSAPRPVDVSYDNAWSLNSLGAMAQLLAADFTDRRSRNLAQRARELSLFLGIGEAQTRARLESGFAANHAAVAEDFRRANPQGDEALLDWYRKTDAYLYELSVYHCDPGFNYRGMIDGIAGRLPPGCRVLVLGDGIGDASIWLAEKGFRPIYHDLEGSLTARFARYRMRMYGVADKVRLALTKTFSPPTYGQRLVDAVVCSDFLEHVPNVEAWVSDIHDILEDGGLFFAQNAFAAGSGPDGSIPCHLQINDRFERDWDPLLARVGFEQLSSNWYRKL